jgi:hypothetical protein
MEQELVLLQYPAAGTRTSDHPYTDGSYPTVHENEAGKFVALDTHSGGYPYAVEINRAHDFGSVEKAEQYRGHFKYFNICLVRVTYDIVETFK